MTMTGFGGVYSISIYGFNEWLISLYSLRMDSLGEYNHQKAQKDQDFVYQ